MYEKSKTTKLTRSKYKLFPVFPRVTDLGHITFSQHSQPLNISWPLFPSLVELERRETRHVIVLGLLFEFKTSKFAYVFQLRLDEFQINVKLI